MKSNTDPSKRNSKTAKTKAVVKAPVAPVAKAASPAPAAKAVAAPSAAVCTEPAPAAPAACACALPVEQAPVAESACQAPVRNASSVKVTFSFFDPVATKVTLAGEFNDWCPETNVLKRKGDGLWEATLSLKPGTYQYKFIVDGLWVHDPKAESQANAFGTLNSLVQVAV